MTAGTAGTSCELHCGRCCSASRTTRSAAARRTRWRVTWKAGSTRPGQRQLRCGIRRFSTLPATTRMRLARGLAIGGRLSSSGIPVRGHAAALRNSKSTSSWTTRRSGPRPPGSSRAPAVPGRSRLVIPLFQFSSSAAPANSPGRRHRHTTRGIGSSSVGGSWHGSRTSRRVDSRRCRSWNAGGSRSRCRGRLPAGTGRSKATAFAWRPRDTGSALQAKASPSTTGSCSRSRARRVTCIRGRRSPGLVSRQGSCARASGLGAPFEPGSRPPGRCACPGAA